MVFSLREKGAGKVQIFKNLEMAPSTVDVVNPE